MARFFVAASNIFGGIAYINGKDAEHAKVLRLREGEIVTVCDGKGTDYSCRVRSSSPGTVEAEVIGRAPSAGEPDVDVTVYAAWPKGDKAETIVQKTVELGAKSIVFYPSERCVSRPDDISASKKCARLARISEEAAKQCGRGVIPEVRFVSSYDDMLLEASRSQLGLFFYEEGGEPLRDVIVTKPATVSVVTGPEGGFEPSEAARAADMRLITATLGARILRCETAPTVAVASVMLLTGNLG